MSRISESLCINIAGLVCDIYKGINNLIDYDNYAIFGHSMKTPKEVFENKDLFKFFLPILRADFQVVDAYKYLGLNSKLDVDVSIINGNIL
ncbi:hypothetical protein CSC2_06110 [Clostridium zeae]|uniref:Uncharacterized protein n=1 Tax=Clostridium zeae TaxID=2759022 RepID=A0ABQ1E5S8_9CLOT|nr:hypothetical protein [Clostridium zeae]GFZ30085.1 hypothetical protein CSC2_06110 [Clostridium zeae]